MPLIIFIFNINLSISQSYFWWKLNKKETPNFKHFDGNNVEIIFIKLKIVYTVAANLKSTVQWEQAEGEEKNNGIRLILNHFKMVKQVTWHGKGDYFATVMPDGQNRSVLINQLSKRRSQLPFRRPKGLIQCVLFHPIRPFLFVAVSWLCFLPRLIF